MVPNVRSDIPRPISRAEVLLYGFLDPGFVGAEPKVFLALEVELHAKALQAAPCDVNRMESLRCKEI